MDHPMFFVVITAILLTAVAATGGALQTEDRIATADGDIVIHPIHHATFVMEWNGRTIWVDPVGGADLFADLPRPDLVLITHIHGDHMSAETVDATVTENTTVIAPKSVFDKLGPISGTAAILAPGESFKDHGVQVKAVPAYNLSEGRRHFHPKERGDNGYIVTLADARIFISGDTEGVPEMRALEDIDAAFLCMNLPYTMDVDAAADAALAFAPSIVYPYHYRGQDGMSDLDRFTELVAANPAIEVRRLQWY